jgi:nitrite reductase (NADH) small subunit/3-phenylpropionate/trans-cinnamate dioxygenase ferredoxin subunit
MTDWHRLGSRDEVAARAPYTVKRDRHPVAVFLHDGRFRAICNICNHEGGPLCQGQTRGEFVTCPWHGWEYSVVTGRGREGYEGLERAGRKASPLAQAPQEAVAE